MTLPAWDRDEFVARIQALGREKYHDRHPFQRRMNEGLLDSRQLRGWIVNRFEYQRNIPVKDALIVPKLPSEADRRRWMTRIDDHQGVHGEVGGMEAWLRLGEAAGAPRQVMLDERSVEPGARQAVRSYVDFCRERPWLEAVASSLTELFAPALIGSRMAAIEKHYPWVDPAGLEYFRRRLHQAPRDVDHGLELVLKGARTRDEQERVLAAVSFKCGVLWTLLDAVAEAYPDRSPGQNESLPPRPRLARRAMLRHDQVRSADLLLLPERVIKLNATGAAVLRLCDGRRTVTEIVAELRGRYNSPVESDVKGFLARLKEQGALE